MTPEERECLATFCALLEKPAIGRLLARRADVDRFSIAACFAYFLRAKIPPREYTERKFAVCLYIDNLMQDDDCEANDPLRDEIESLCAHYKIFEQPKGLRREVFQLMELMHWRAMVSCRTANAICSYARDNRFFRRERPQGLPARKRATDVLDVIDSNAAVVPVKLKEKRGARVEVLGQRVPVA